MLYILLTFVHASEMFTTMLKNREIPNFIQGNRMFHLSCLLIVSYQVYLQLCSSLLQLLGQQRMKHTIIASQLFFPSTVGGPS